MQFLVLGYDGTDEEALARRMAARPSHLESVAKLRAGGTLLSAAAILNEAEQMVGSMMLVDFPDRESLDAWLKVEPYVTGAVWQEVKVSRCKVAT